MASPAVELKMPERKPEREYAGYWDDPKNILAEIEAGEKERNKFISQYPEMLMKFQGPGRLQMEADSFIPYNFYYEWISLVRPQIAFQNPRVRVRSKKPDVNKLEAIAMEFALNRWIRDTHYIRTIERATTHAAFNFGVTMTTLEDYGGDYDDPRSRPRKTVLDPAQFGMDSICRSWEESRIFFHRCVEDKADLLRRAQSEKGWDIEAIKKMPTSSDVGEVGRPKADVDRGEVQYWSAWVPGNEDDDSETHGKILTLGTNVGDDGQRKAKFLREAYDYYGPRWGPYTLWDFYFVPRSGWPMGPLQAQEGLTRYVNAQAKVNLRRAKDRKDLLAYDDVDQKNAELLLSAPDGSGVGLNLGGSAAKMEQLKFGGVNEDELMYEQWLVALHERGSGIGAAQLGQKTGQTATHDAIGASGLATRIGFLEQKVYDAVKRDITTVAYFYWKTDSVVETMPAEFHEELAKQGIQVPPGAQVQWKGDQKTPFDDLEFEIEPYSMQRTDEANQQALALQLFQLLTQTAPMIAQAPWMPWQEMFNRLGKAMNFGELGDKIDYQMAQQIGLMLLQAQVEPQQTEGSGGSSPRMSSDMGSGPGGYSGPSRPTRPAELGKGSGGLQGQNSGAKLGAAVRSK